MSVITIPSTKQLRLTHEEANLLIQACWTARQQAQLEKNYATNDGDYRRVGELEDIAERLWVMILKLTTA